MRSIGLALLLIAPMALAQDPKDKPRQATLRWYGQSFFQLQDSTGQRIVFDPHAIPTFGSPRVKADFVLISHLHDDHNQPEVLDAFLSEDPKVGMACGSKTIRCPVLSWSWKNYCPYHRSVACRGLSLGSWARAIGAMSSKVRPIARIISEPLNVRSMPAL